MPRENRDPDYSLRLIAATSSILLFLLTLMVIWMVFSPHTPAVKVTYLTVNKFNITPREELTAVFNVEGILRNPNIALSLTYERLTLALWFGNFTISSVVVEPPPFSIRGHTHAPVRARFEVAGMQIPNWVASEIAVQQRFHGGMDFGAMLDARFRYKFGMESSKVFSITLQCYPLRVELHLNDTMNNGRLVEPSDCYVV